MSAAKPIVLFHSRAARILDEVTAGIASDWEIKVWMPDKSDEAELRALLAEATAVVATPDLSMDLLCSASLPKLRLCQLMTAGYDWLGDLKRLPAPVIFANCNAMSIPIAEYCLGQMLTWQVRVGEAVSIMRRGLAGPEEAEAAAAAAAAGATAAAGAGAAGSTSSSSSSPPPPPPASVAASGPPPPGSGRWVPAFRKGVPHHRECFGKTVGVVGAGAIGTEVASRARAFGMRVLATVGRPSSVATASANFDWVGSGDEALEKLLAESDFVVLSCPCNDHTRGMINAARLKIMRGTAVLINVARGAVVDEDALFAALQDGTIAGACIDVWWQYPTPGGGLSVGATPSKHDFHLLENVVATPHFSGWTEEQEVRKAQQVAANLNAVARGEQPRFVVKAASAVP